MKNHSCYEKKKPRKPARRPCPYSRDRPCVGCCMLKMLGQPQEDVRCIRRNPA